MRIRSTLLLSAAFMFPAFATSAQAQPAPAADQPVPAAPELPAGQQPKAIASPQSESGSRASAEPSTDPEAMDDTVEGEEIVIVGAKPRGSVIGDIPPEDTLDSRDVRATGATSINDLLEALAPQLGSAQGRGGERPVLLLNGQRISSFREMRDIPTEAIQRVEILPEEVALKYGYRADQKVVNIVLRPRFRSTVAQVGGTAATEGGYEAANADVTRLMIQKNGRTQFNLHAEGNSGLSEAERRINLDAGTSGNAIDALSARSLVGAKRDIRGSVIVNRQVLGNVSATLNGEVEHKEGRSLLGLGDIVLAPLARDTTTDSAHAGLTLNWDKAQWHWNVTGNADWQHDRTRSDADIVEFPTNRARETSTSADLTAVTNGTLFKVPAGNVGATVRVGASTVHLDSERESEGHSTPNSLGRTAGNAALNLDLPVSRRGRDFSALGNLTLNANAEVNQLSDFGTLTKYGVGASFSPVNRLNFVTSWTREEGAPTINQLGDPQLITPGSRIFDFTNGETAFVTAITGGNPDLDADRRTVLKLGGYWQPVESLDLRLRADYVHQRIERPISNITATPTIERAFPDRFTRDADNNLVRVDLRPVNFDSSRRDTLRVGFDFSKPLKSRRPSQAVIDQMRRQFGFAPRGVPGGSGPGADGGPSGARSPEGGPPSEGGPRAGAGGFGRGRGGGFGGGSRGRLTFSLTDTITLQDRVTIAPGLPDLDYLHGDAAGQSGGTPRHKVEAQAGWANNGFGARLGANWATGTRVNTLSGDDLRFSPLATFDLKLFANLGDQPETVLAHPWLRGSSLRLEVNNLFDAKPRVHDAFGRVPRNYQPDLLDPLGRTVMITFRKLFLPPPSFFRQQREREQQHATPTR